MGTSKKISRIDNVHKNLKKGLTENSSYRLHNNEFREKIVKTARAVLGEESLLHFEEKTLKKKNCKQKDANKKYFDTDKIEEKLAALNSFSHLCKTFKSFEQNKNTMVQAWITNLNTLKNQNTFNLQRLNLPQQLYALPDSLKEFAIVKLISLKPSWIYTELLNPNMSFSQRLRKEEITFCIKLEQFKIRVFKDMPLFLENTWDVKIIEILKELEFDYHDLELSRNREYQSSSELPNFLSNSGGFFSTFYFISWYVSLKKTIENLPSDFRDFIINYPEKELPEVQYSHYLMREKKHNTNIVFKVNKFKAQFAQFSLQLVNEVENVFGCPIEFQKRIKNAKKEWEVIRQNNEKEDLVKKRISYLNNSNEFKYLDSHIQIKNRLSMLKPAPKKFIESLYEDYLLGRDGIECLNSDKRGKNNLKDIFKRQNKIAKTDNKYLHQNELIKKVSKKKWGLNIKYDFK